MTPPAPNLILSLLTHVDSQNVEAVTSFMKLEKLNMSDKPSLTLFAALTICLENSFWYQSASVSFINTFRQAFEKYMEIAMQKVEIALKELGDWSKQKAFQSALYQILLKHRLPHPDNVTSSN